MNVIAFLRKSTPVGNRLQRALESVLPAGVLIICGTLAALTDILSRSHKRPKFVILLAASQKELDWILEMKPLLRDRKIILILPDDSEASFALGCLIFPRYICDIDSDFMNVAAVLEKMMLEAALPVKRPASRIDTQLSKEIQRKPFIN